jgi:hypothetical protein
MNVTDQKGVTTYVNTNGDNDALVVVYDPNGGFTVGSGSYVSPQGAIPSNPTATPKITFGFQSNYYKGATNPKGETEFDFDAGDFQFNALNFDYLVVDRYKAQFKGSGKISNQYGTVQSGISFIMTVIDGQLAGGGGVDKIRMKIYNKSTGQVYYDNMPGASEAAEPVTAADPISTITITSSNMTVTSTTATTAANTRQIVATEAEARIFDLKAFPNPTTSEYTVQMSSSNRTEKVQVRVMDLNGRVVQLFNSLQANQTIKLGANYRPGVYVIQMIQGKEHKELKVVKLPD